MRLVPSLAAAFAILAAWCVSAQTITGAQTAISFGPPPPTTCLFGSALPDGCAGADQNASFTVQSQFGTSFYTRAASDGQVWTAGAHPWGHNSPAIDYPVGPDKATVFKDWTTTTPPIGCVFNATGNPFSGGPWISCTSGDPVFDGWDFTTAGGGEIRASGAGTHLLTTKNSKFLRGQNLWSPSNGQGYFVSSAASTNWSLDFENNLADGGHANCFLTASSTASTLTVTDGGSCGASAVLKAGQLVGGGVLTRTSSVVTRLASDCPLSGGTGSCALANNTGDSAGVTSTITVEVPNWDGAIKWNAINDTIIIKYNAFINQPELLGGLTLGGVTDDISFNYAELELNQLSITHGAWFSAIPSTGTVVTQHKYSYNVSLLSALGASSPGGATTTFSLLGNTGAYSTYNNIQVVGNVAVSNMLTAGRGVSVSSALFQILDVAAVTGTFEAHDNWVSPHGGLSCVSNTGDATITQFWVDDGSAGPGADSGIQGNVFHITADANLSRGKIYVGSNIGSSSVVYGPVSAYGAGGTTGTGLGGTYLFTGSAIHVPVTGNGLSTVAKTWDSPITTVGGTLITGPANKVANNLLNGEDIDLVGVQWNLGNCTLHP